MPKYSKTFKQDVFKAIRQGLHVNTIASKFNIPPSTARLWVKECAAAHAKGEKVETVNLDSALPSTTAIVSRNMNKVERAFVSKLLETYKPINLSPESSEGGSVSASENKATHHIIFKDFNAFYDRNNDNLDQALSISIQKAQAIIMSKGEVDVKLHFIGDHFNTGSLYMKRIDEPEQYRVFMAVFHHMHNLISRVKSELPFRNVDFQVEGADFRGSLLDSFLRQTFMIPFTKPEDNILFLSGLSSKSKEDEHIKRSFRPSSGDIVRTVYTDLRDISLGPIEFSFGDLNMLKGCASIKTLKGKQLCTVNIVHW